jgi:hypothetical protein
MDVIVLLLLLFGFVLFVLAGVGVAHSRVNLVAAGLACWILTVILHSPVLGLG